LATKKVNALSPDKP